MRSRSASSGGLDVPLFEVHARIFIRAPDHAEAKRAVENDLKGRVHVIDNSIRREGEPRLEA